MVALSPVSPPQANPTQQHQHGAHELGDAQSPFTGRRQRTNAEGINAQPFYPDTSEAVSDEIKTTEST